MFVMEQSETLTPVKSRYDAVDIAKGILIIAVVLSHAWFAKSKLLANYFPYSMPAFFFLSGYTYKEGRGYFVNIGRRFVRLVIPYICFGAVCNLFYPLYMKLSMQFIMPGAYKAVWIASAKADAINMLMSTPMWFLAALFTASIIFYLIVKFTHKSLGKTIIFTVILLAAALVIDIYKKAVLPWFIDLAPYAVAFMLIGAYCGEKQYFSKLSLKSIVIGVVLLAFSYVMNHFFPGSAKTSVVTYIEPKAWYGVLTAFCVAFGGSIGILAIAGLVDKIPVLRKILIWAGRNSIWILCIHYCVIMLVELYLFNHHQLTNSIMQVVAAELFGYGKVVDTTKDIFVKILVAVFSIGVSAIYAIIHNSIKKLLKKKEA